MKKPILITGATGLVGKMVCQKLFEAGDTLILTSRDPERAKRTFPFPARWVKWDPLVETLPTEALRGDGQGLKAVIHLAGESVAGGRWTSQRKKLILDSRALGTRNLVDALMAAEHKPEVVLSASAVGYYGDRGDEELTEDSLPGTGFLSEVCQAWEKEVKRLNEIPGIRWAIARIGIVLSTEGGALGKLIPLFRSGVGGAVGSGKQWMSWIHSDDLVAALEFAVRESRLKGVFNAVAPNPRSNAEFSHALGKALGKPAWAPAPAFALRAGLGEMSEIVLASQKVKSSVLEKLGFSFRYSRLEDAFAALFALPPSVVEAVGSRGACDELRAVQWIPQPLDKVFEFFSEAKNLETLTPDFLNFKIQKVSTPAIQEGTLIDYTLKVHGVPIRWRTRIEDWQPGRQFVDTQLKGPYRLWHHTHQFRAVAGGTLMEDRVRYRLPMAGLGRLVAGSFVRKDVEAIFRYRFDRVREIFGS